MAIARGLHLAAELSLLGTGGFIAWMLPAGGVVQDRLRVRLALVWSISGLIALLAGIVWVALQAGAIADAGSLSELLAALPVVGMHTRYGKIMTMRLGLLVLALLLSRGFAGGLRLYLSIAIVALALSPQGMIGHAGATGGAIGYGLVLSEALHLLAAGCWLGALLPLGLSLRMLSLGQAVAVCERFSPIGLACVLVLAGTGFAQGLELIGGVPALLGTRYGQIAMLKIALFVVTLVLAALNRLWLTDRLGLAGNDAGQRVRVAQLVVSVCVETFAGLAIVALAALLASSVPALHVTPVWPLSWQFSLATVNDDPQFRWEVITSLVAIGATVALMVAALIWRRFRLLTLGILITAVVSRGPSLSLLTAEAYPTSFQTSPTEFSAVSIVRGRMLFGHYCVACHGADGAGDGPAAAGLRIKPTDLTMPHLWVHTDGELFWWLTHGVDDPDGGLAMPAFGDALQMEDRWAMIDYVRAHNAGLVMRRDIGSEFAVRAPALPIACAGTAAAAMADLRGRAVYVVADAGVSVVGAEGATLLALRAGTRVAAGACDAASEAGWGAYAVLAGVGPEGLAGTAFLVDPDGWLRGVRRPGGRPGEESLAVAIARISANPIKQAGGGDREHHH